MPDVHGVLGFVPGNAGGVPLGYLVDFWMIRLVRLFRVHCPAAVRSVHGSDVRGPFYPRAARLNLRTPLLAAILYAVSPLTLRYALEARPYAQAACWSAFATVVFLSLIRKPTSGKRPRYAALVALGLFTQPYSIFVPVAHLIWCAYVLGEKKHARVLARGNGRGAGLARLSSVVSEGSRRLAGRG